MTLGGERCKGAIGSGLSRGSVKPYLVLLKAFTVVVKTYDFVQAIGVRKMRGAVVDKCSRMDLVKFSNQGFNSLQVSPMKLLPVNWYKDKRQARPHHQASLESS